MRKKRPSRTSSNRTAAIKQLDILINEIKDACSKFEDRSNPSLADLKRALQRARSLRRHITDENRRVNWKVVLLAIVVLAKVAEKILSILFCKQPRGVLMRTGSIIRTLRTVQSISQTELAQELKVTRAYLSQIENGRTPSLSFLKDAAERLQVPLVLLVSGEDERAPDERIHSQLRKLLADLVAMYLSGAETPDGGKDFMNAKAEKPEHPRFRTPLAPPRVR